MTAPTWSSPTGQPSFGDVVGADRTALGAVQKGFDNLVAIEEAKKAFQKAKATGNIQRDILGLSNPETFSQDVGGILSGAPMGVADMGAISDLVTARNQNMQRNAAEKARLAISQSNLALSQASDQRAAAMHPFQVQAAKQKAAMAPLELDTATLTHKVNQDAYVDDQQARALTTPENISKLLTDYTETAPDGSSGVNWEGMFKGLTDIGLRPEASQKVMQSIFSGMHPNAANAGKMTDIEKEASRVARDNAKFAGQKELIDLRKQNASEKARYGSAFKSMMALANKVNPSTIQSDDNPSVATQTVHELLRNYSPEDAMEIFFAGYNSPNTSDWFLNPWGANSWSVAGVRAAEPAFTQRTKEDRDAIMAEADRRTGKTAGSKATTRSLDGL